MAARTRPPELDGLTFIEPIGSGGFADVFLYQQALPSRRVAIKVLREAADSAGMDMFRAEANVMAQLSGHPSIVPIHQAGVSQDGRAFLVMEYCPPPHLGDRFRTERIPVPEVLEVAVRIASAVETAHRAGILHRDIKPHNILTSAYGAPLLTDFGIASVVDAAGPSQGMSIPWSPPEALADDALPDVRSDVFSLAATVYSLLAGRSPFEIPGAANDPATLMHRIENQDPSRILRADVPESLNALLRRAMARDLGVRPGSGMAFARAVQEVQIELHLTPTRLEVMDASPDAGATGRVVEDARTEVKPISIIIPDAIAERGTLLRPTSIRQVDDRTSAHPSRPVPTPDTRQVRPAVAVGASDGSSLLDPSGEVETVPPEQPPVRRRPWPAVVGLVGVAVVTTVVVVAMTRPSDEELVTDRVEPTTAPGDVVLGAPARPTGLTLTRRGDRIVVRWTNPDPRPGDTYQIASGAGPAELDRVTDLARPTAVLTSTPDLVCVAVTVVRQGTPSPALEDCVGAP